MIHDSKFNQSANKKIMKRLYKTFFLLLFISFANKEFAQSKDAKEPTKLFRVYEEDDFFNITGHGTDKSYSNGTRLDFLYQKKDGNNRFFPDRWMPKAGDSSKNMYGWGLMQIMVTPSDISIKEYQPHDYPYSGALLASHSLYSFNPQKKYMLQTDVLAGIRGPASGAKEVQTWFHNLINYQKPEGWDNQLRTMPLLNVNFTAEKQFYSVRNFMEINGGTSIGVGSLADAFMVYPLLRIGKMAPYFDGYFNQLGSYKSNGKTEKMQYYFVFKPMTSIIAYDALVQGKRENEDSEPQEYASDKLKIKHFVTDIQLGAVLARGNCSISYMQTYSSAVEQGRYNHSAGNLCFYYRW